MYRKLGATGESVSALAFGAMRLPHEPGAPERIIKDQAQALVHRALALGVNLFDTAWNYHREMSETFLGDTLSRGERKKLLLSTKLPCWQVETPDDAGRFLDRQMERLRTDRLDIYLLHGLDRRTWERMRTAGIPEWGARMKEEGRIRLFGFSFHDSYETFTDILPHMDWDLCLLMLNYVDTGYQAGLKGVLEASAKGMGVMIMEPLRGGFLAGSLPPEVLACFPRSGYSPAALGLRWVWNIPAVSTVLSGMSTMEQLEENAALAGSSSAGCLGTDELEAYGRAREAFLARAEIPCTQCEYCMPCPRGVAIPWCFNYYNYFTMHDDLEQARTLYGFIRDKYGAHRCDGCGTCLARCPRTLSIPDLLGKVHSVLG